MVGTDYFTKWVEAEPLSNIRDVETKRFVWKNIVTRFGIPHTIISDNGLQFDSKAFNLIVRPSRDTIVIWALGIGTPPWLIHKGMDRPRLTIKS